MRKRFALRRGSVWTVPGLSVATPVAAATSTRDLLSDFDFGTYLNFTTFNWPTLLLVGSVGLLIVALVAKVAMAARPSQDSASSPVDEGIWRRVGNMPAEPPEVEPRRRIDAETDARPAHEGHLPPYPV